MLPQQGVVVVGCNSRDQLVVFASVDGARLASTHAVSPGYIAADPDTARVYAGSTDTSDGIASWTWDGKELLARPSLSHTLSSSALAVMQPAPGQRHSYLIAGARSSTTMNIYALPQETLVYSGPLCIPPAPGKSKGDVVYFSGLASDPGGTALLVGCSLSYGSEASGVHVVAWPLQQPEFPTLE